RRQLVCSQVRDHHFKVASHVQRPSGSACRDQKASAAAAACSEPGLTIIVTVKVAIWIPFAESRGKRACAKQRMPALPILNERYSALGASAKPPPVSRMVPLARSSIYGAKYLIAASAPKISTLKLRCVVSTGVSSTSVFCIAAAL